MWFKVDDKLHDHRKARKARKAAMGVWVLAGSWSMDNRTDGFIPESVLSRWGNKHDASVLVAANFWFPDHKDGEDGWQFHAWLEFQPDAKSLQLKEEAESAGGAIGNHRRWHSKRGVVHPDCEFCHQVPDWEPDQDPDGGPESVPDSPPNPPVPEPDPHISPNGEMRRGASLAIVSERPELASLCEHLAARIAEDGSKRPAITKGWLDAARLMLDKDGRNEAEIHQAIDWCQGHQFWRTNILSMPTLRQQFDRLRKVAAAEQNQRGTRQDETNALFDRAARHMGITGGGIK